MCHDCNRSWWSLLMRKMKMSINISWLTATVSVIHEWSLLGMTIGWWVHMMGMWSRGTAWAVVYSSMLGCGFGVLGWGTGCINHDICYSWRDMLVDHSWDMYFTATAAVLRRACNVFALLREFVRSMCSTCTVGCAAGFMSSFTINIHIYSFCWTFYWWWYSHLWTKKNLSWKFFCSLMLKRKNDIALNIFSQNLLDKE